MMTRYLLPWVTTAHEVDEDDAERPNVVRSGFIRDATEKAAHAL